MYYWHVQQYNAIVEIIGVHVNHVTKQKYSALAFLLTPIPGEYEKINRQTLVKNWI